VPGQLDELDLLPLRALLEQVGHLLSASPGLSS
jgi:hypothetical protein